MLKINHRLKNETSSIYQNSSQKLVKLSDKKELFEQQFKSTYQNQFQNEISDLILKLEQNGKRFSCHPNKPNLMSYKRSIQLFLQFVNKNSFNIKEIYGRRIDYKIVNTINDKLESLSQEVLSNEVSRLDLASKLDEIRGLIIDLIY